MEDGTVEPEVELTAEVMLAQIRLHPPDRLGVAER